MHKYKIGETVISRVTNNSGVIVGFSEYSDRVMYYIRVTTKPPHCFKWASEDQIKGNTNEITQR